MPPKASARAKAKAKPMPKIKTKVKARALRLKGKLRPTKVHRLLLRRSAVKDLSKIAKEMGVARIGCKTTSSKTVERLVLTLQGRCVDDDMRRRLGTALQTWLTNGAQLVGELVETNSDKITEVAIESERPIVGMHEMLKKGYSLKSRAFRMTYNSSAITRDTWDRFWTWFQLLSKRIGAAGRAAC